MIWLATNLSYQAWGLPESRIPEAPSLVQLHEAIVGHLLELHEFL